MKAVIYTRISTEYQEDGHSPEEQLRRCQAYAEMEGHEVVAHYHDTGSGSGFEHRPNYLEMMSKASKEWRVVVIYKLDRIHRSLRNHVLWMDELRTLECDFISTEERVDTSTPQGRFFIQIMASYAEMERETISSRVKMGLEGARRSGRWIGVPPYGYKMDDTFTESGHRKNPGVLIPVETEADVVKTILKLHVEGYKLSEIITQLVLDQSYTRSGTLVWNRSTVKAVLNRCQLYLAGATGLKDGGADALEETFLFGTALQQTPIYGYRSGVRAPTDDPDFELVAGALLEVSVDDESNPDFVWVKLTHTEQLNNNSLVRRTIQYDEEE